MASDMFLSETELFETIGSFGRWQQIFLAILFYSNIVGMFQSYAMTFFAPNVPFKCIIESDSGIVLPGQCQVEVQRDLNRTEVVSCTRWEYNSSYNTLVSKWDLVCDREWLISFSKSVFMIGFLLSCFVFGQVSDWIGRYPTMLIGYTIAFISQVLSLFSSSITYFLIYRFFLAFGRTGYTTIGMVLLMEVVGPQHRTRCEIAVQLGWSVSYFYLAFVGYFLQDWFWIHVSIAVPLLLIGFAFIFIPESPRWLLMHKKIKPLRKLIETAAKRNKIELTEDINHFVRRLIKSNKPQKKGTLADLFRTLKMRSKTLKVMYLWFVNCFIYYTLSYNTNDFYGDPYLNFLLLGLLEVLSNVVLFCCVERIGRRITEAVLVSLSGSACLLLLFVPQDFSWISTALSHFGKFCVTASFGLLYLYTNELFPTVVRSAALGSGSLAARIGSVIAPFSKELGKATYAFVPNVVIAILGVSGGLLALWLPETAGRKLPDSLEEGEDEEKLELQSE